MPFRRSPREVPAAGSLLSQLVTANGSFHALGLLPPSVHCQASLRLLVRTRPPLLMRRATHLRARHTIFSLMLLPEQGRELLTGFIRQTCPGPHWLPSALPTASWLDEGVAEAHA